MVPANLVGQCCEERHLLWNAGFDAVQFRMIGSQAGQPLFGRRSAFVGNVVGAARKTIDDLDRLAQGRGNEK